MTELFKSGDTVVIISAGDPSWIGKEGRIERVSNYRGEPISYKLDIGGGDWLHSCLALVKKACKFCSDYTEKIEPITNRRDSKAWFSLYEHYIEVVDDRIDGNILSFKIKYCPMCGKNLSDGE